jgi:uncharacterized RDD family membrane protein YckC
MKCPTCGYIGFETSDRCRNCGYEFAQAAAATPAPELSLRDSDAGGPLREIAIHEDGEDATRSGATRGPNIERVMQNLDRMLGDAPPDLPLFNDGPDSEPDLPPLVSTGTSPRRPLAVRRATPDPARLRPKPVRHQPIAQQPLELPLADTPAPAAAARTRHQPTEAIGAPPLRRAVAALIDLTLLAAIDLVVVYFTLRMCGLSSAEVAMLPAAPLGAFFLLVNGGYLAAFTAAGGQTIGKMACGLRVVGHADQPVSGGLAIIRAAGCLASLASLGLGFIPALVGEGGRAIEDRLADTRVVRVFS